MLEKNGHISERGGFSALSAPTEHGDMSFGNRTGPLRKAESVLGAFSHGGDFSVKVREIDILDK